MRDVCIVGAGVAGLVTARYMKELFSVTIFEASANIGGIWLFKDNEEGAACYNAMYKNLRTNLPKQLMSFRDFPHESNTRTFLTHGDVQTYLESYCDAFSIRQLINFETPVLSVSPDINYLGSNSTKWIVDTPRGRNVFDAIAVCTGRYDKPHIPDIEGLDIYAGTFIHSKDYSVPESFHGQHVLVVGAHASGIDLTLDLFEHGVKVDISHRRPDAVALSPLIKQYSEPIRFNNDRVFFKNEDVGHKFDVIIFATGYDTNLGFLQPDCSLETDILPRPLYKFLINPYHPTMALLNQCAKIAPFPFSEYQALYFRDILLGKIALPDHGEMLEESRQLTKRLASEPFKYQYNLDLKQFEYNQSLGVECGIVLDGENDMTALCDLYDAVSKDRATDPSRYRNKEYAFLKEQNIFKMVNDWNKIH